MRQFACIRTIRQPTLPPQRQPTATVRLRTATSLLRSSTASSIKPLLLLVSSPVCTSTMSNPAPKEDTWAFQTIGSPFPDNPVKVAGQQNMYVALWYKNGKPVHGYAWNDGGVVQASFPWNNKELTGKDNLGGLIQVLQYKGDHTTLGYWYEWIAYKDRFKKTEERQLLRCGDSIPMLWQNRPGGPLLGFLNLKTEEAFFSADGKAERMVGKPLAEMWIVMRNTKGGPAGCACDRCANEAPPSELIMLNEWDDIRVGDPWPTYKMIKAADKTLNTVPGECPDQMVALWYVHGEPVMGRIWNKNGKVAAAFGWGGKAFLDNIGSIQVLRELSDRVRGFDYYWRPFPEAATFDKSKKEYHPVHVDSVKGDISPCVLKLSDGKEMLGKVDVRGERASAVVNGKEMQFVGPAVHPFLVLCRKAKPGQKFV